MHNLRFIYIATQTVEVSLNYLYYQCHISGEKLHGKRCVNTFLHIKSSKKQFYQRYREKMFSFYTIWFGLYRIYTFEVSYLFLMVVFHLRYMTVVFTSPLLGLCLLKAPSNGVLRDHWPFCWQILDFLLSPHNKFLPSKEQPGDSNSHTYQDWEMPLWFSLSVTGMLPAQSISLLLQLSFPTVLLLEKSGPSLVSFWKLFGNKKQTQGSVVRWGCDFSPLETWVPRLSRGWWSLPSQHQVFFNATQLYGIWEQHYIDPKKESSARYIGTGLWETTCHFLISPSFQIQ